MSDFTAIIYRKNDQLNKMLKPMKESVDFFYGFPSCATPQEIGRALQLMKSMFWQCVKPENILIIMDMTCATSHSPEYDVLVIRQSETVHEEYVKGVVDRLKSTGEKEVVIIEKSLADHCELRGRNPYKLTRRERSSGGWYYEECKTIWKETLEKAGIKFSFVSDTEDISQYNCVIANTHTKAHRCNRGCICAYSKVKEEQYSSIEEILSHCRAIGRITK